MLLFFLFFFDYSGRGSGEASVPNMLRRAAARRCHLAFHLSPARQRMHRTARVPRTGRRLCFGASVSSNHQSVMLLRLCSVPQKKKYYAKKKFSVTSNLRYMHEILNVDEIKN
jgi:hypothetical protein